MKENEKNRPYQRSKNPVEHEGDGDTSRSGCTWNGLQWIGNRSRRNRNKRKNGNHSEYSIIKISQTRRPRRILET